MTTPPRRPFIELAPPPDGFRAVSSSAARRRRTKFAVTGAGGLGVLTLVLALAASAGPRDDSLRVTDPVPDESTTAAPQSTPSVAPSASESATAPTPSGSPGALAAGSGGVGSEPSAAASPGTSPASYRTPEVRREYVSRASATGTTVCSGSESGTTDPTLYYTVNWCHSAAVNVTRGGHDLTEQICRDSSSDATLSFDGSRELDLVVQRADGKVVWRWSVDHPDAATAHTLAVEREHCWVWTVHWTDVNQAGTTLPHGAYTLVVSTTARELGSKPREQADFTI